MSHAPKPPVLADLDYTGQDEPGDADNVLIELCESLSGISCFSVDCNGVIRHQDHVAIDLSVRTAIETGYIDRDEDGPYRDATTERIPQRVILPIDTPVSSLAGILGEVIKSIPNNHFS